MKTYSLDEVTDKYSDGLFCILFLAVEKKYEPVWLEDKSFGM